MSLLELPTELLFLITAELESDEDLSRLLRVNHRLYSLVLPLLYQRHLQVGILKEGFFKSIVTGNERAVKHFLHWGADVNHVIGNVSLRLVKVPIKPWFDMQTPLNVAANVGNDALVSLLLDHGAEIHGVATNRTRYGKTQPAAVDALLSGHQSTVRLLLERGARLQGPDMQYGGLVNCALYSGQISMFKLLIEFGVDLNAPINNRYPLFSAVCYKGLSTAVIEFLLDHGADIVLVDDGNGGLLKEVIPSGAIDTARLLLERGASCPVDVLNSAINSCTLDTIRLLVEHGAQPDYESLMHVVRSARCDILELFIAHGVDLNMRNPRGSTVLHSAVCMCTFPGPRRSMGRTSHCMKTVATHGLVNRVVLTPQHVGASCWQGNQRDAGEDIVRCLIRGGADVNAMDGKRETPLYLAWKYAPPAVQQMLLDAGADWARMLMTF
jgi:ankyrin repeat protein